MKPPSGHAWVHSKRGKSRQHLVRSDSYISICLRANVMGQKQSYDDVPTWEVCEKCLREWRRR
jgi:hypothetical protein